ncbi:ankyrin and armadillo repeat-containing protein-like [Pleurodeles waltl]|uniref:ankyrin and armadillo repeat-containing protein-like n=1 Tax=Pleurodeles waltl TaxID=8319 RepID=UPI0037097CB9
MMMDYTRKKQETKEKQCERQSRLKKHTLHCKKFRKRLVEGNPNAQKNIMESNGIAPLVSILKQSRTQHMQEAVAEALWAVAGTDVGVQREVAARIGVHLLVEFLGCQSHRLHLIGIMGLSLLVQSPYDIRDTVASTNSMQYLTRLLQSHSENVVLSTIRALRHMCLSVGYIPHRKNQKAIANSKGLTFLIALMVKSHSELIQVEAANTLAAMILGNAANMELLYNSAGFSHMQLLRLLHSSSEEVRLLAGAALATFAFNSFCQQRRIVDAGGVRWHHFQTFLQSEQEIHRVQAAFQSTVLARIIPDNESASTSALGIKILVDTLQHSTSNITLALAADCVARLAHIQSGVPDALVAVEVVPVLCQLLSSTSDEVQGCAAIALRYLSFNPQGERQLLKRGAFIWIKPGTPFVANEHDIDTEGHYVFVRGHLEKAFDLLEWPFLFTVLRCYGIGSRFLRLVQVLYIWPQI